MSKNRINRAAKPSGKLASAGVRNDTSLPAIPSARTLGSAGAILRFVSVLRKAWIKCEIRDECNREHLSRRLWTLHLFLQADADVWLTFCRAPDWEGVKRRPRYQNRLMPLGSVVKLFNMNLPKAAAITTREVNRRIKRSQKLPEPSAVRSRSVSNSRPEHAFVTHHYIDRIKELKTSEKERHHIKRNTLWDDEYFTVFHASIDSKMKPYAAQPIGSCKTDPLTVSELSKLSSWRLPAVNCRSRYFLGMVLKRRMLKYIEDHVSSGIFFLTLTPRAFAVPLSLADNFDVQALIEWCRKYLGTTDYIGSVEGGFYSKTPELRSPGGGHMMSWHAHIMLWNCDKDTLRRIETAVNADTRSLVEGSPAAHFRKLADEELGAQLLYMMKAPWRNYRVWLLKGATGDLNWNEPTSVDATSRKIRQEGNDMHDQPGLVVQVAKAMVNLTMREMTFASGPAENIRIASLKEARQRILHFDQKRLDGQQRLLDSVFED